MVYRPPVRSRLSPMATRRASPVRVASPTRRARARPSPTRRAVARPSPTRRRLNRVRTSPTRRRTAPVRKTRAAPSPRRRAARARSSPRRGKKGNPWIEFIKAHKGQGYTFKELSKMYRRR